MKKPCILRKKKDAEMFSYRPERKHSVIIDTKEKLIALSEKMMRVEEFAFDTETNSLDMRGPKEETLCVGISISWGAYNNYYIPLNHRRNEDWNRNIAPTLLVNYLKEPFERKDVRIITQNGKFDFNVLYNKYGIDVKTDDIFDTMLASWLCDENTPNGLKENSMHFLGIRQTKFKEVTKEVPKEVKKAFGYKANNKVTFDLVLIDDGAPYALDDAFFTFELYRGFQYLLKKEKMSAIYNKVYVPYLKVLYSMEKRGICIDVERLNQMRVEIQKDIESLEYRLTDIAGIEMNFESTQQLAALLFGYEKPNKPKVDKDKDLRNEILKRSFRIRPISYTDGGAPQVNSDTIWSLSKMKGNNEKIKTCAEFCSVLLEYKRLTKLQSAFIEGMAEMLYDDGKVHPSFNQIGTDSGRLSSSRPNAQQIPREREDDKYGIRSLFIGSNFIANSKGEYLREFSSYEEIGKNEHIERKKIISCDFSNLEMRVLAVMSNDKNLVEMFLNGHDSHGSTAVNMFNLDCTPDEAKKKYPNLRQAAKTLNFMLMYGGGATKLCESLLSDHEKPIDLGSPEYLKQYGAENDIEVAQIFIDKYFETYNGVSSFMKNQKKFAHRNGYVETIIGRKRRLPEINSSDKKMVSYLERLSVNSPIQGSAADMTTHAQLRIDNDPWFEEHGVLMISQIHDELMFECPEMYLEEAMDKIKYYMENCFGEEKMKELPIPITAEPGCGASYAEAK